MSNDFPYYREALIIDSSDLRRLAVDDYENIIEEMSQIWYESELQNDFSYITWAYQDKKQYPYLAAYIEKHIPDHENKLVLIHYWW